MERGECAFEAECSGKTSPRRHNPQQDLCDEQESARGVSMMEVRQKLLVEDMPRNSCRAEVWLLIVSKKGSS